VKTQERKKYLKKHNAAIRSHSKMTLLQKKIANVLLYNAYDDLLKKQTHEISISELLNFLGMKTNNYERLKQAIRGLVTTLIEWNVIEKTDAKPGNEDQFDSKENWFASSFLAGVNIKRTLIRYQYSDQLKQAFHFPRVYTKGDVLQANKFKSIYSLSLYELALSYLGCGTTGWITLESFRKNLCISTDSYRVFRDFKHKVLEVAIAELNCVSDLEVYYETRKIKKNSMDIKLIINPKKRIQRKATEPEKEVVKNDLVKFGISSKQWRTWTSKYDKDYIDSKIELMRNSNVEIKNSAGFLNAALKNDYQKNIKQTKKNDNYEKLKLQREKKERIEKEYNQFIEKEFNKFFCNMSHEQESFLRNEFVTRKDFIAMPSWRRAKDKLSIENWFLDKDVLMCLKIIIVTMDDNKKKEMKIPKIPILEEYKLEIEGIG